MERHELKIKNLYTLCRIETAHKEELIDINHFVQRVLNGETIAAVSSDMKGLVSYSIDEAMLDRYGKAASAWGCTPDAVLVTLEYSIYADYEDILSVFISDFSRRNIGEQHANKS